MFIFRRPFYRNMSFAVFLKTGTISRKLPYFYQIRTTKQHV
ncbi:hypothetical protein HMPREF3156_00724 [Neisseria sp. HMSC06F02]|nr:hypothetical protein HMPREF3156_00724 [Neisseria sp. HMSC06F02]